MEKTAPPKSTQIYSEVILYWTSPHSECSPRICGESAVSRCASRSVLFWSNLTMFIFVCFYVLLAYSRPISVFIDFRRTCLISVRHYLTV